MFIKTKEDKLLDEIILYSNNCPRCNILEGKLDELDIEYLIVNDINEIMSLGYLTVPLLSVNGEIKKFAEAIKWCNEMKEGGNGK